MTYTIVTGAGSGIGRAISLQLAREGHEVVATDLDLAAAEETAALSTGAIHPAQLDVSSEDSVGSLISGIDFARGVQLVNNAGIGVAGTVEETTYGEWQRLLSVNAGGVFLMCHHAIPLMVANGGGSIVNISSIAGLVGLKRRAAYCASKAAVIGLTRAIAVDYAAVGIRCNAIAPGTVSSPWIEKIIADSPDPESVRSAMAARQLDGVMGTPEEVAGAVSFLLGPSGRFANGSVLVLDGGVTAA